MVYLTAPFSMTLNDPHLQQGHTRKAPVSGAESEALENWSAIVNIGLAYSTDELLNS